MKHLMPSNDKDIFSRHLKTQKSIHTKIINLWIILIVFLICFIGLLMVFDASAFEAFKDFDDRFYYIRTQIISFLIGFILLIFFVFFDYHRLEKFALPMFLISVILLLLVFIPSLGVVAGGAHRWLKFGFFTIQPAEIIKLTTTIYLAHIFQKKVQTRQFIVILTFIAIIIGVFQKDLGSTIVYCLIAFSLYFIAGAPIIHFLGLFAAGIIGVVVFILSAPYRIHRILAFLDPFADPQGYTYHISQVLIALGSGGLIGLGIGQSRQKFAYIPEVTTDSIFSVIGEEFGFIGCLFLISLFSVLIFLLFKIIEQAPDKFGKLLATGFTIWLGAQIIVNLSSMVSLLPLTGVPLPFISYGGSALIVNLVSIGILINISRQKDVN